MLLALNFHSRFELLIQQLRDRQEDLRLVIQIQQVSSYILTLQGSNPPGAKEPQGTEQK